MDRSRLRGGERLEYHVKSMIMMNSKSAIRQCDTFSAADKLFHLRVNEMLLPIVSRPDLKLNEFDFNVMF